MRAIVAHSEDGAIMPNEDREAEDGEGRVQESYGA